MSANHAVSNQRKPIIFLLGPSAAGKTSLGQWIQEDLSFLWIELDMWGQDGYALAGIRTELEHFFVTGHAGPLAAKIEMQMLNSQCCGAVFTFPSMIVFSAPQLEALSQAQILVLVLYGGQADCVPIFLKREQQSGRNLPAEHWFTYNLKECEQFSRYDYDHCRIPAFKNGLHRDRSALIGEVRGQLRRFAGTS